MAETIRYNEATPCEACGRYGAYDFDGRHLCADCYQKQGSCCPEFGGEDQWQFEEDESSGQKSHSRNSGR